MSEAAAAVEGMNGVTIDGATRPLKVIIASSRQQGSRRDDNEMERLLRLFILIPKDDSITENELKDYFSQFGTVEYVFILRDKETNGNKGFAYVKFFKMYDAAKALEECDPKYKAILARPKEKRGGGGDEGPSYKRGGKEYQPYNSRPSRPRSRSRLRREVDGPTYPSKENTKLSAFVSTQLTENQVYRLFDLMPGLEFIKLGNKISYRTQQVLLEYDSPQTAEYTMLKLNGFEYPIGEPILVKSEQERGSMYYA